MPLRRTALALAIAILTTAGACAQPGSRPDTASESARPAISDTAGARQAIARMNGELSSLATTRNADSVAAWFAPDAIVLVNGAAAIRGRDSIRTFYDQFFQAMPIREMSYATQDVAFSGDVAIETGTSTLSIGGPGQPTPVTVAGKYLAVWRRQPDGRWLIWRHAPSNNALPR